MNTVFQSGTGSAGIEALPVSADRIRDAVEKALVDAVNPANVEEVETMMVSGNLGGLHAGARRRLEIKELLDEALRARFAVHEDSPELEALADTAPRVAHFVERVISALEGLRRHYEGVDDDALPAVESLEEIGALISAEVAGREIADLAFIAAMNLRESAERLNRLAHGGRSADLVALCDAAMHQVRRALIPLENALCRMEGLPAPHRQPQDIKVSVHTRRAYSTLRHDIVDREPTPSAAHLPTSLANTAHRLRLLRASSVYPYLRLNDRLQMRGLCQRIRKWLQSGPCRSPAEGSHLWLDTVSFLRLLDGINCRQELEVHDFDCASTALRILHGAPLHQEVPDSVLEELQSLFGRNDEIDRLLLDRSPPTGEEWAPALHRLCRDLHHVAKARGLALS